MHLLRAKWARIVRPKPEPAKFNKAKTKTQPQTINGRIFILGIETGQSIDRSINHQGPTFEAMYMANGPAVHISASKILIGRPVLSSHTWPGWRGKTLQHYKQDTDH